MHLCWLFRENACISQQAILAKQQINRKTKTRTEKEKRVSENVCFVQYLRYHFFFAWYLYTFLLFSFRFFIFTAVSGSFEDNITILLSMWTLILTLVECPSLSLTLSCFVHSSCFCVYVWAIKLLCTTISFNCNRRVPISLCVSAASDKCLFFNSTTECNILPMLTTHNIGFSLLLLFVFFSSILVSMYSYEFLKSRFMRILDAQSQLHAISQNK